MLDGFTVTKQAQDELRALARSPAAPTATQLVCALRGAQLREGRIELGPGPEGATMERRGGDWCVIAAPVRPTGTATLVATVELEAGVPAGVVWAVGVEPATTLLATAKLRAKGPLTPAVLVAGGLFPAFGALLRRVEPQSVDRATVMTSERSLTAGIRRAADAGESWTVHVTVPPGRELAVWPLPDVKPRLSDRRLLTEVAVVALAADLAREGRPHARLRRLGLDPRHEEFMAHCIDVQRVAWWLHDQWFTPGALVSRATLTQGIRTASESIDSALDALCRAGVLVAGDGQYVVRQPRMHVEAPPEDPQLQP